MLQCSFSFVAAQLLEKLTSSLQKSERMLQLQLLQHNFPKIAAQFRILLVACGRGRV